MSRCIADVSTILKEDQVPHGKCAEMEVYAEELPALVADDVGTDRARVFQALANVVRAS